MSGPPSAAGARGLAASRGAAAGPASGAAVPPGANRPAHRGRGRRRADPRRAGGATERATTPRGGAAAARPAVAPLWLRGRIAAREELLGMPELQGPLKHAGAKALLLLLLLPKLDR